MAACTLHIGSRRVLVSDEGPPAAEFALFDPGDVELAQGDGGALQESGYRTTAGEAASRLASAGLTPEVAEECASLVRGRVAEAYARGPVVRKLAALAGPAELFEGGTYDATLRRYEGAWLDLPLLANDAGIARATGVLHALSLVALLAEVARETPVVLSTGSAESLRLGERTLRRHAIAGIEDVPRALLHLSVQIPPLQHPSDGPTREAIETALKARLETCASDEAREQIFRLGRMLNERPRPSHGPLADAELWEIDRMLAQGKAAAALARIDAKEGTTGREPATIYLRARAALLLGNESPRLIAQRVGELAISMSDFPDVELLAAQAWNAAGETRIAIPFARDLVSNPRVHDELRIAAQAILRSPRPPIEDGGGRDLDASTGGEQVRGSSPPPTPRAAPRADTPAPRISSFPSSPRSPTEPPRASKPPPAAHHSYAPLAALEMPSPMAKSMPPAQLRPSSAPSFNDPRVESEVPTRLRSLTPPSIPRSDPPPRDMRRYLTPPERTASPLPPRASSGRASAPPAATRNIVTPSDRPMRISDHPPPTRPSARIVEAVSPWPTAMRAPREENVRPEEIEHTPAAPRTSTQQRFMRGASLPPLATEPPPPPGAKRPSIIPRVDIDEPELIETLPLPRGASEAAIEAQIAPRTSLEARIRFTLDARELARRYRHEDGIELRLDNRAVTAMQRRLTERFRTPVVSSAEEAREAELHGALLAELLARLLDAEWIDIAPTELGYWAMSIPTRDGAGKRVWPFGRVLRFIASGGEDDLVAFFRKLRELA
jgi:hypothetical protein